MFDETEIFATLFSFVAALVTWGMHVSMVRVHAHIRPAAVKGWLLLMPVAVTILLWVLLRAFADAVVRASFAYLAMYTVMGLAWVGLCLPAFRVCGLDVRQDVVERRNPAARTAAGGAIIGVTLCFAGGNLGDGPSWMVVVFCALLSSAGWFLLWMLLELFAAVHEKVTVERDPCAGMRLGAYLIAQGAILGRAVAGDWVGIAETINDFVVFGSPGVLLLLIAITAEWGSATGQHDMKQPSLITGAAVSLGYLGFAGGVIMMLGWW